MSLEDVWILHPGDIVSWRQGASKSEQWHAASTELARACSTRNTLSRTFFFSAASPLRSRSLSTLATCLLRCPTPSHHASTESNSIARSLLFPDSLRYKRLCTAPDSLTACCVSATTHSPCVPHTAPSGLLQTLTRSVVNKAFLTPTKHSILHRIRCATCKNYNRQATR